jgi:hypothetical protein
MLVYLISQREHVPTMTWLKNNVMKFTMSILLGSIVFCRIFPTKHCHGSEECYVKVGEHDNLNTISPTYLNRSMLVYLISQREHVPTVTWLANNVMKFRLSISPAFFPTSQAWLVVSVCRLMAGHHVHHEPQLALAQLHHQQQQQRRQQQLSANLNEIWSMSGDICEHNHSKPSCFQLQLVTCWMWSPGFRLLIRGLFFHRFFLNRSIIFLKSWASTAYVSNSTGSSVTPQQLVFPIHWIRYVPCISITGKFHLYKLIRWLAGGHYTK